ncbi:MAG TPA: hypothetical protein DEF43_10705 [Chloroflexus aurantiacus]|jgi:hypothetical protein|uniref:Uncharacterized protein n=1 Tax=Chloroflexus aurantiacus (strain ATCC 29366 / DSM 635 / J-10-fl) TaxID=324602 RepID=A9WF49_CHLAA|nr:hypothetical protein [Chloroflexus aurantiacus]ABY35364.1 hypothetical protein Caur_2152 [Chloroflexus aurantiacus J-10-fl]RMG49755.1 MAG: hypothetical protein D6716_10465 [Chloroflexota bacterium]GIV92214.1 MAG: hypothetical protein KatS3mg056_0923 [Chloroflexus sp.]HBW67612.1 hypothetical protein [Chloroflexus aurantiacus]
MPIRALHLSEDGVSRAEQDITLTRIAPGQITLNNQQVLAIRALDRCTLALEVLGETHYLPSADYWHAASGNSRIDAQRAGCLLGHLDCLAIAAHQVLTAFTDQADLSPQAQAALTNLRAALTSLELEAKKNGR